MSGYSYSGLKADHHRLKDKWVTCNKCNKNIENLEKMISKKGSGKVKYYHKSCYEKLFL